MKKQQIIFGPFFCNFQHEIISITWPFGFTTFDRLVLKIVGWKIVHSFGFSKEFWVVFLKYEIFDFLGNYSVNFTKLRNWWNYETYETRISAMTFSVNQWICWINKNLSTHTKNIWGLQVFCANLLFLWVTFWKLMG